MARSAVQDNRKYEHTPSTALYQARQGNTFILKGASLDTLSAGVVQTATGTFEAIPVGSAAVVKGFMIHLHTVSDEFTMEIGKTSIADATGDFVALSPELHIETGAALAGAGSEFITLPVPMYIEYSATAKALAVKLTCNDDSATVNFAVAGWIEEIG